MLWILRYFRKLCSFIIIRIGDPLQLGLSVWIYIFISQSQLTLANRLNDSPTLWINRIISDFASQFNSISVVTQIKIVSS